MTAAFEGAPGVDKTTLATALRRQGAAVVPEVNGLFLRPAREPADWYPDRQNARWEVARGLGSGDAAAKVARYVPFAAPQRRFFEALSKRFPGWITFVDTGSPGALDEIGSALVAPAAQPDRASALRYATEWLEAHTSAGLTSH